MEKIFIKKLNKEIKIDLWKELNFVSLEAIKKHLIDSKISSSIINEEINEDGFIVDFVVEKNLSEKQLPLIEGKVKKILEKNLTTKSKLPSTEIKFLKLRGVSGLTLEDEKKQGNRIFGFASLTKESFENKLAEIEEKESRDHRKIGKELDLFFINELSGKGLPIWLENGVLLKKQIQNYIWSQEEKYGSTQIETPVLGSIDLYKTSGHYSHYKDSMFPDMTIEKGETFILRPMACPHHVTVYKRKPRSYKDLPVRYSENVKQYRFETSGSLLGLERVRGMELTDSHIFLREDQLLNELNKGFELVRETLEKFEIDIHYVELALHDSKNSDKYHGDKKLWLKSEKMLKAFLDDKKVKYKEMKGEAAFYGPKIDIQIKTALGHIVTVSTIQLDFLLPEKFKLTYIGPNKEKVQPIMIHRGLIGTYERFISILLEQTKGDLPMWLNPQQAVIIPVNNKAHLKYANDVLTILKEQGVRVKLDDSDERLSNKIRIHQQRKVKTQIIIGDEEMKNKSISYRFYGSEETKSISLDKALSIYAPKHRK